MLSRVFAAFWPCLVCLSACGPAPLEPREPSPGATHFKLASFNVELDSHSDHDTVAAVGATEAEVVSLQEVTPSWVEILEAEYSGEYPYRLFEPRDGAGGLAVLSKYPLENLGVRPGPGGWHPAWHVIVDSPAGPLQLLTVHLRSLLSGDSNPISSYLDTPGDHLSQIQAFSEDCEVDYSTVVLGDFNEEPDGKAVSFLENLGFENALPLYHPGQPTWRHRSVADQLEATVDHILFDTSFEPLNSFVVRKGNSDHWPVVAHLEVRDGALSTAVVAQE